MRGRRSGIGCSCCGSATRALSPFAEQGVQRTSCWATPGASELRASLLLRIIGASGLVMISLAVSRCWFIVTLALVSRAEEAVDGTPPHARAASYDGVMLPVGADGATESGRSRFRRDSADSNASAGTGRMFRRCAERRGGMMCSKRTHSTR